MTQKVARMFVSEAIANSHAAIKACWLIVFSAGTFAALSTINSMLLQYGLLRGVPPASAVPIAHPGICTALFAVFVLTFLRFYVGDVRIFDIRYSEVFKLANSSIDHISDRADISRFTKLVANSDRNLYKFEIVLLTFQTLIIVFLAFQISDWENFARAYTFLMVWNIAYLVLANLQSQLVIRPFFYEIFPGTEDIASIQAMFPMKASRIWIYNNSVAVVVLVCLMLASDRMPEKEHFFGWCATITLLANCFFDGYLARDFYFPRFSEFLEKTIVTRPE
jgi:hypothetical protein